jgi:hypothetical protein
MFHFREPGTAVVAGLDLVERAPVVDPPPAHVGIHTGPVISQDGDVYGRTVNLAARIASYAQAGQVVVSEETAHRSGDRQVWFDPLGAVELRVSPSPCRSTRPTASLRHSKRGDRHQAWRDPVAVSTNDLPTHFRAGIASACGRCRYHCWRRCHDAGGSVLRKRWSTSSVGMLRRRTPGPLSGYRTR